jgi:hypothetical protein
LSKDISIILLFQWIVKCVFDYNVLLMAFSFFLYIIFFLLISNLGFFFFSFLTLVLLSIRLYNLFWFILYEVISISWFVSWVLQVICVDSSFFLIKLFFFQFPHSKLSWLRIDLHNYFLICFLWDHHGFITQIASFAG